MSYTYTWTSAEQTGLRREDDQGKIAFVPVSENNCDYAEFLESGAVAAPYVAPPELPPLTTEEKLNNLLSDYGLSREELKTAIYEEESN